MTNQLDIKYTNKVGIPELETESKHMAIYEGVNQDGQRVRVYVGKIEILEEDDE